VLTSDCPGAEQHGELLPDPSVRRAHHVAGIGEQADEPGDDHLHAGLFEGLPDGGRLGALPHVDTACRKLPAPAVDPADEEQSTVPRPHRDEH
jgi:hypothetical protein